MSKQLVKIIKFKESADIEKMSRPRITFPQFKDITNRPDQDVKTIETKRQKELFGRQVANAKFKDRQVDKPIRLYGGRTPIRSKSELVDAYGKKISSKFDRNTLGLSHNTPQGPKSAALAGKLISRFETPDEEHKSKLDVYESKVADARSKYEQELEAWKQKSKQLPEDSDEYWTHIANQPKFKKPRKPSKTLRDTNQLSPEEKQLRGKSIDSTIEHEGFHDTISRIENKYGPVASSKIVNDLIGQHHPNAIDAVGKFIVHNKGYKRASPIFNEELITHARDILVNPKKREQFKKFLSNSMQGRMIEPENFDREAVYKQIISNLKIGHQKAYNRAKQISVADVRPDLAEPQESQKIAASVNEGKYMKKSDIYKTFLSSDPHVFKNEGNQKLKPPAQPKLGPHFIFSAENPMYKDQNSLNLNHNQVLGFLKQKGYKVEEMSGSYGGPEKSIIVHNPPQHSLHSLMDLATRLGQESSIMSDGENHKLYFHHGDMRGKYVKGKGTTWHKEQPKDYYSTLPSGHHFTHNFNFDEFYDTADSKPNSPNKK